MSEDEQGFQVPAVPKWDKRGGRGERLAHGSAADFIETTYGDVSKYLESKIEAEIKALDTL